MVAPEAEHHQYLSKEIGTKPKWISIQEMISPGTIGFDLVMGVEGLGQRQRPESTFNQPIVSLWKITSLAHRELESHGIKTVAGILELTSDEFFSLTTQNKIKERLQLYLEDLALTPHAKLLQAIFLKKQYPIPPDRELELVNPRKVEGVLDTLTERMSRIVKLRFGIETGVTMTLKEIGAISGVTREAIRIVKAKALRRLYHPSRSRYLRDYLSVPPQSFGRQIFGAILSKDLPKIEVAFKEVETWNEIPFLKLSEPTKQELIRPFGNFSGPLDEFTLHGFLIFDPQGTLENLSDQAFREIKEQFERLVRETQEKQKVTEK